MRRPAIVVALVAAFGVLALVLVAVTQRTSLAFTLGVVRAAPVSVLTEGDRVCQRPIDVPSDAAFDRIGLSVGTFFRAGSPLAVDVEDLDRRVVARGRLAGGYPDIGRRPVEQVALDRTVSTRRIAVCVSNEGPRKVALYGNADPAARTSTLVHGDQPLGVDLSLVFERDSHSMLSDVPRILDRATLFRFPGMSPWVYVVLFAALAVVGPWMLARAVTAATADRPDGDEPRPIA